MSRWLSLTVALACTFVAPVETFAQSRNDGRFNAASLARTNNTNRALRLNLTRATTRNALLRLRLRPTGTTRALLRGPNVASASHEVESANTAPSHEAFAPRETPAAQHAAGEPGFNTAGANETAGGTASNATRANARGVISRLRGAAMRGTARLLRAGTLRPTRGADGRMAVRERLPSEERNDELAERGMYQNPVIEGNNPDPAVIHVGGRNGGAYYAVATSNLRSENGPAYPMYRSTDGVRWDHVGHIFNEETRPEWAERDLWAPEVHRINNRYVAYFTARDRTGRLVLGAATARNIRGPWRDIGHPMLTDSRTGIIDSHLFRTSSGENFLAWKLDGNDGNMENHQNGGRATPIYIQRLSRDGLSLQGRRVQAITNDLPWEGPLVEAPWVEEHNFGADAPRDANGQPYRYFMFYSANVYDTDHYAVGVARATSLDGPWEKHPTPILHSNSQWVGPGHGAVTRMNGRDYFLYHAWRAGQVGGDHARVGMLDEVHWENGWPRINDGTPSAGPMPRPIPARTGASVSALPGGAAGRNAAAPGAPSSNPLRGALPASTTPRAASRGVLNRRQ